MPGSTGARSSVVGCQRGLTLPELLIGVVVFAIIMGFGSRAYIDFNRAMITRRAASVISSDVTLTRSYAIQRRANVSLVANEMARTYVIRADDGTVLTSRYHDATADLPLDSLDVRLPGDSVVFNARGVLVGAASAEIELGRDGRVRTVQSTALGRTKITTN